MDPVEKTGTPEGRNRGGDDMSVLQPVRILSRMCHSPEETHEFGRELGARLVSGDTLALIGPLGAGKTHLARGLARGLQVPEDAWLTSPTFTLMAQFPCRLGTFYHLDLYRLDHESHLRELGFSDVLCAGGVVAVEWWDRFMESWLDSTILVRIDLIPDRPLARMIELWILSTPDAPARSARLSPP